MLDVLQTIRDEVVTEVFIESCKEFVEKVSTQSTIVLFCNTDTREQCLMTVCSAHMHDESIRERIRSIASYHNADGIVAVVTGDFLVDQTCMAVHIETMLARLDIYYPYDRVGRDVEWKHPVTTIVSNPIFIDLLPAPAGMAQA